MKVVCIILLFVIAAAIESVAGNAKSPEAPKGNENNKVILKFPKYISDHKQLAEELLHICEEYSKNQSLSLDPSKIKINDKFVSFKNCTFLCKYGSSSVRLDMPPNTPCGPEKQTCADKTRCVEHIPGC
uniref:Putative ixodes 8-cys protein n=1 Tax=Ixodes ricinus TaxID=34613 RepID=A0A0K8RAW4_IXORI